MLRWTLSGFLTGIADRGELLENVIAITAWAAPMGEAAAWMRSTDIKS